MDEVANMFLGITIRSFLGDGIKMVNIAADPSLECDELLPYVWKTTDRNVTVTDGCSVLVPCCASPTAHLCDLCPPSDTLAS